MSVLQTVNLSADAVKLRWREPYVTVGLNVARTAGDAKGVVRGFSVVPNAGYLVTVALDPALNVSIANVRETTGGLFTVTIVQPTAINVDLTAQAGQTVFICLDAQFAVGSASAAQVKVVDAAELTTNVDLIVLAKVSVPGVPPVVTANINTGYRLSSGDSVAALARPPINLIFNSGFEADGVSAVPAGWTVSNLVTLAVVNTIARSGSKSLQMTAAAFISDSTAQTGFMPVVPLNEYRASVWLRTDGAGLTGTGVQVKLYYYDTSFSFVSSVNIEGPLTGIQATFVQRAAGVVVPTGVAHARLVFVFDPTTTGVCYVDDVELSTNAPDALAHSAVFGGPNVVADNYHTHTAGGVYSGSGPWADGTTIPPGTIESGIDGVVSALGAGTGAAKVGFAPATPVDLTAVRVDTAINELDDKKASLAVANTFTAPATWNNATPNSNAVAATGNGTGHGVVGTGGATSGSGVRGTGGGPNGVGVVGTGLGTGAGVSGTGGATSGIGVTGTGTASGSGVQGTGGPTDAFGVNGLGGRRGAGLRGVGGNTTGLWPSLVRLDGAGVTGIAGTTDSPVGTVGVYGEGSATGSGVLGVATAGVGVEGSATTGTGVSGNSSDSYGGVFSSNSVAGEAIYTSSAGAAIRINGNTSAPARYDTARTMTLFKTGNEMVASVVAGTFLYGGASVSNTSAGVGVSGNVNLFSSFRLPLGAVITGVSVLCDHSGSATATFNLACRKFSLNGVPPTPWNTANVLTGAVFTTIGISASALVGELVAASLNATVSNRTVNNTGEFFSFNFNLTTGAGGSAAVQALVVTYDMTDVFLIP